MSLSWVSVETGQDQPFHADGLDYNSAGFLVGGTLLEILPGTKPWKDKVGFAKSPQPSPIFY